MERGMKWFKFLIYFVLWANAVLNIIMGIMYFTGGIYAMQDMSSLEVYDVFPKLDMIDKVYAIVLVGLAIFALITRFALAGYKSFGPLLLYGVYIFNTIVPIVYAGVVSKVIGVSIGELLDFTTIIVNGVMVLLNFVYFSKRSDMFNN